MMGDTKNAHSHSDASVGTARRRNGNTRHCNERSAINGSVNSRPAFTPTCSLNHVPGYIEKEGDLQDKGVALIAVTSVNDVFVMNAWAKSLGADHEGFVFLADGSAVFAKAIGLTLDLADRGLGLRSQRYAMLVDDGVVTKLNIETASGKAEVSSAEALLKQL